MSNRKKCQSLLDSFSDAQMDSIAAILEAAKTAIEDAADDAFCRALYQEYEADANKGKPVSYRIMIDKPALKFLEKQSHPQRERLLRAIYALPHCGDTKPLSGAKNLYRLRVGTFRVIYTIMNDVLIVQVLDVGNHGDVYK